MFCKNIFLRKKKYTSNASRRIKYYHFRWQLRHIFVNKIFKHLTFFKISQSGRNDLGKRIIRTKGALLIKKKKIKINYSLRYLRFGTIVAFKFLPFQNKLLTLLFFSNGAVSFYLATAALNLFQFWGLNYCYKTKKLKFWKNLRVFNIIQRIKKLTFISCVELYPGNGAQYARSSGTKVRLMRVDKISHTALIQLPSKLKKLCSSYSFALYDQLALPDAKRITNTKSGYWRSFGNKPIVRGVAMNPVDHPHGGRTKTIKHPLTPWGKTTKFK